MKISRNTKLYYSDSEIKKRQEVQIPSKLKTKRTLSSKISSDDPTPLANTSKKHLFSSNISFKTAVYQLLSEEVYDDLISFLFILMSLPVIILKRIFLVLSWLYKQFDHIFLSSLNKMNKMLDEKKKSSFEQRRFSKNTKLEIYFKKKQIEERSKLCKENKLDLVLDLDETLINCRNQKPSYKSQEIEISRNDDEKQKEKFYFSKRPFLEDFLKEISLFFNVHVYTASEKNYADAILSYIDPKNIIQKRLYRNDCFKDKNDYTKDLTRINEDLSKVIMIDNSEEAVKNFLENSFIIKSWHGIDRNDTELEYFTKILIELAYTQEDIRNKIKKHKRDMKSKYFS